MLTVDTGLPGIRIAPFFRRLLVLVVIFLLIVVLLVFGSRIDAPSLGEFASLGVERLVEHFHGFPRIRFAEQATWYARGHRRAGQHCEVNFATERSCQHLEDFFCFDKIEQPTRWETTFVLISVSIFFRFSKRSRAAPTRISNPASELESVPLRFPPFRTSTAPRPTDPPLFRSISADFSVKISRKFGPATYAANSQVPN